MSGAFPHDVKHPARLRGAKALKTAPQIPILLLLISFYSVGAMVFAPALPAIAKNFSRSTAIVQCFVSVYLLGVALGQLIYGPLSNRFGRKVAVYGGISLAMLGIVMSMLVLCKISF